MKKLFLLLSIVFAFIRMEAQTIGQASVSGNSLILENMHDEYVKVSFAESIPMREIGDPELPMNIYTFVIPIDAKVQGVRIENVNENRISGNYKVYPAQPDIPVGETEDEYDTEFKINSDLYNSSTIYPVSQTEILFDGIESGYHIVKVAIYPIRYIPASGELYVSDITFSVDYTVVPTTAKSVENLPRQSQFRRENAKKHIQALVYNPEDIEKYSPQVIIANQTRNIQIVDTTNQIQPLSAYFHEELVPDYIIITSEELKESFQPLADWKTQKGIPAIITTVEDIYRMYPGVDRPEQIRNYLIECYKKWNAELFVLIGGNIDIVPARYIGKYPSDLYYQTTSGTWYTNTGNFFNSSVGRNLYVGRIPARDVEDVDNFISKVLRYEKSAGISDRSYYNNILTAGGFINKSDCEYTSDNEQIRYSGYYFINMNQYLENAKQNHSLLNSVYMKDDPDKTNNIYSYNDTGKHCTGKKYNAPNPTPDLHVSGDLDFNRVNFLNKLNTGKPHLIYHMDHSSIKSMGTSSKDKGENIIPRDFENMQNGNYLQIMYSGGCKPATFSSADCMGAHYINARNGGGVAFLGNSDNGYLGEHRDYKRFLEILYKNNVRYDLGYLHRNSAIQEIDAPLRLQLFGDPAMQVWTDTPKELVVWNTWDNPTTGTYELAVRMDRPVPVGGFTVCISKGTEYYYVDKIYDNREHRYTIESFTGENTVLTVTGKNYLPYIKSFRGSTIQAPMIKSIEVIDNVYGNGDGRIDAGEEVTVWLKIERGNAIYQRLEGGRIRLGTLNANRYVTLYRSDCRLLQASGELNFTFKIDRSSLADKGVTQILKNDLNPIGFILEMYTMDGEIVYDHFNIDVFTYKLEQGKKTYAFWDDLDEHVFVDVDIQNTGMGTASGLTATLTALNNTEYLVSSTSTTNYSDIAFKETKTGGFSYTMTDLTKPTPRKFSLEVTDRHGKTDVFTVDLDDVPQQTIQNVSFEPKDTEIVLRWNATRESNIQGYNIYRASRPNSPLAKKVNTFVNPHNYFVDYDLEPTTEYYYRIAAVNKDGTPGAFSDYIRANTSFPNKGLFPVSMNFNFSYSYNSAITFYDFTGDGKKEIFTTSTDGSNGHILGFKSDGTELFDIDHNPTTYSGFASLERNISGAVSIADISHRNVIAKPTAIAVKRDNHGEIGYISGYINQANDIYGLPDIRYRNVQPIEGGSHVFGAVLSNLSNDLVGGMDIITVSSGDNIILNVLDNQGILKWKKSVPNDRYVECKIAVGSLGKKQKDIVIGTNSGVYAFDYTGKSLGYIKMVWQDAKSTFTHIEQTIPIFSSSNYCFVHSAPVICDLDGDGINEIIIRGTIAPYVSRAINNTTIFVLDREGNLKPGWGTNLTPTSDVGTYGLVVADIYGDGNMYVIEQGLNIINIYDKNGVLIQSINIPGLHDRQVPIVADMDGDEQAEIIVFAGDQIVSYKIDGSITQGFPIQLIPESGNKYRLGVCDLDNTGFNDLVAAIGTTIYVWETSGRADRIEWGMERGNAQLTGEYSKKSYIRTQEIEDNEKKSPEISTSLQRDKYILYQNTPNPFNTSAEIRYHAPCEDNCTISIQVFNVMGAKVKDFTNISKGNGSVNIEAGALSSGVYLYVLIVNGELIDYKRMIVE